MKVFFSWSGQKSHKVAHTFAEWLPCVVQAVAPWISSKDIDRGAIWFSEILEQLQGTNFGVVLVTKENQDKPWLMFETGALSKGLRDSRICTVLVDLHVRDIDSGSPLHQLNHTSLEKEGVLSLLKTINKGLESGQLPEHRLEQTFSAMWPTLEASITEILSSGPAPSVPHRTDKDVLNDILDNVLQINRTVAISSRGRSRYIDSHHAEVLIKQLIKMDYDRGDVIEATDGLIPEQWLKARLNEYFGPDPEDLRPALVEP